MGLWLHADWGPFCFRGNSLNCPQDSKSAMFRPRHNRDGVLCLRRNVAGKSGTGLGKAAQMNSVGNKPKLEPMAQGPARAEFSQGDKADLWCAMPSRGCTTAVSSASPRLEYGIEIRRTRGGCSGEAGNEDSQTVGAAGEAKRRGVRERQVRRQDFPVSLLPGRSKVNIIYIMRHSCGGRKGAPRAGSAFSCRCHSGRRHPLSRP